jgi:hypothetical protein
MPFAVAVIFLAITQALPPLDDRCRFLDQSTIRRCLEFNRAFQDHLRGRIFLAPCDNDLQDALEETRDLYRIWDTVDDLWCDYIPPFQRQLRLQVLRSLLGEEAYRRGLLPPCVPLWRFARLD